MSRDRYPIDETPESAEEREDAKSAAYEREIDRADMLRDEQRDREMEERTLASHRPPRYFLETTSGMKWEWRNGTMTTDGAKSIFRSPADIMECLDVVETDEDGNPLEPSAEDVAAEKGDREQQREADES
jgi:hypothetical protein